MSNPKGVILRPSKFSVHDTINRLVVLLQNNGATIYARINQQSEVHNVGLEINPLEFILFGNPEAGGLIIAQNPMAALDLPLKIIAWKDNRQKVWLAYNDEHYLQERYYLKFKENASLNIDHLVTLALNS